MVHRRLDSEEVAAWYVAAIIMIALAALCFVFAGCAMTTSHFENDYTKADNTHAVTKHTATATSLISKIDSSNQTMHQQGNDMAIGQAATGVDNTTVTEVAKAFAEAFVKALVDVFTKSATATAVAP